MVNGLMLFLPSSGKFLFFFFEEMMQVRFSYDRINLQLIGVGSKFRTIFNGFDLITFLIIMHIPYNIQLLTKLRIFNSVLDPVNQILIFLKITLL